MNQLNRAIAIWGVVLCSLFAERSLLAKEWWATELPQLLKTGTTDNVLAFLARLDEAHSNGLNDHTFSRLATSAVDRGLRASRSESDWIRMIQFKASSDPYWNLLMRTAIKKNMLVGLSFKDRRMPWTRALPADVASGRLDEIYLLAEIFAGLSEAEATEPRCADIALDLLIRPEGLQKRISALIEAATKPGLTKAINMIAEGRGNLAVRVFNFDEYSRMTGTEFSDEFVKDHQRILVQYLYAQGLVSKLGKKDKALVEGMAKELKVTKRQRRCRDQLKS